MIIHIVGLERIYFSLAIAKRTLTALNISAILSTASLHHREISSSLYSAFFDNPEMNTKVCLTKFLLGSVV